MKAWEGRLLLLALLKRNLGNGSYQVSLCGDGLYDLSLPAPLWLYKDEEKRNDWESLLRLSRQGLGPEEKGELQAVRLVKFKAKPKQEPLKRQARLELEAADPADLPLAVRGLCLCIKEEELRENKNFREPYFFQIRGLKVTSKGRAVARVKDYFETKAHGILVLSLGEEGELANSKSMNAKKKAGKERELMLPCVEEHVQWDADLDHIEVPHFESFLEAEKEGPLSLP